MDTRSLAQPAHPSTEERPCACNGGWVSIAQEVLDPETGEETEEVAQYLCRRCAADVVVDGETR